MVRLLALLLMAAMTWSAEVSLDLPDSIVPGAVVQAELKIVNPEQQVTKVELPEVAGLEWQIGRTGSQTSIVNGQRSSTVTVALVMRAAQTGTLAIPPITVRLRDGSALTTTATNLRVAAGETKLTGDLQGEVAFDPPTIVPGETTTLTYRLWVRRGEVQTLGINPPEGAITLGERQIVKSRTFDAQGQEWTLVTVTWALTFAEPGPRSVRGQQEVLIPVGDGFFDQRVMRRQVAIAPATVTVSTLPEAGRPANFTGLIGPVTAESSLERERVSVGEGVVLSLVVSGRQTDLVTRPNLQVPGVQLYPKDDTSAAGKRTFRWDVVPAAAGAITIPALSVPYFDPAGKAYRQATTRTLTLTVLPGRSRDLGAVGARPVDAAAPAVAPVTTVTMPTPRHGQAAPRPAGWWAGAAFGGAFVLSLGTGWWLRRAPRAAHRGRALRRAGQDPAALTAALAALRPALTNPVQIEAADRLQSVIDAVRFGGQPLGDIAPLIAPLEGVP